MEEEDINWNAVELAMERSSCGQTQDGDLELCQAAWAADRQRYKTLSDKVLGKAFEETVVYRLMI